MASTRLPESPIALSEDAPDYRGGADALWSSREHEVILSGPYETGKTYAALAKLHALLCVFPKSRGLMVRQTYKSIVSSAVVTYEQKILPVPPSDKRCPVKSFGKDHPEFYRYPNGSMLLVGGLDNPDKFLSAEFDFIYVNQAEEALLDSWEKLIGRATGRAGNAPYSQVLADCNPGPPTHWIKQRESIQLLESRHEDNPTLWDVEAGEWTDQGRRTISILNKLTGLRLKRGRFGLWVAAEGQVYQFDRAVHLKNLLTGSLRIPASWRKIRSIDFGFSNPFVCQWWAINPDGKMILYREIYMTKRTVKVFAAQIKLLSLGEEIEATITDHDAEDRATLEENGIGTTKADKRIKVGIEKTEERLKIGDDGKPGLYLIADCLVERDEELKSKFQPVCTEEEFSSYVYPLGVSGKVNKEKPVDNYNHGMDAMRYAVMYIDDAGDKSVMTSSSVPRSHMEEILG